MHKYNNESSALEKKDPHEFSVTKSKVSLAEQEYGCEQRLIIEKILCMRRKFYTSLSLRIYVVLHSEFDIFMLSLTVLRSK